MPVLVRGVTVKPSAQMIVNSSLCNRIKSKEGHVLCFFCPLFIIAKMSCKIGKEKILVSRRRKFRSIAETAVQIIKSGFKSINGSVGKL